MNEAAPINPIILFACIPEITWLLLKPCGQFQHLCRAGERLVVGFSANFIEPVLFSIVGSGADFWDAEDVVRELRTRRRGQKRWNQADVT